MSATILSTKSNLLVGETKGDHYYNSKPSYFKRGNLLATSSFRQKYKNDGFQRPRSSSYTSLDDDENKTTTTICPPATTSFFSTRKKLAHSTTTTQDGGYFHHKDNYNDDAYDDNKSDNTFFAKQKSYSRRNLSKPTTSWKSSVLKAVGVKSR